MVSINTLLKNYKENKEIIIFKMRGHNNGDIAIVNDIDLESKVVEMRVYAYTDVEMKKLDKYQTLYINIDELAAIGPLDYKI